MKSENYGQARADEGTVLVAVLAGRPTGGHADEVTGLVSARLCSPGFRVYKADDRHGTRFTPPSHQSLSTTPSRYGPSLHCLMQIRPKPSAGYPGLYVIAPRSYTHRCLAPTARHCR